MDAFFSHLAHISPSILNRTSTIASDIVAPPGKLTDGIYRVQMLTVPATQKCNTSLFSHKRKNGGLQELL
jgi:hypothetical protein